MTREGDLPGPEWAPRDLVRFHSKQKLLLLAHDPARYRELGRLVANAGRGDRGALIRAYRERYLCALASPATPGRHQTVLEHAAGYLRGRIGPDERAEITRALDRYRQGIVPLSVPVDLVLQHLRRLGIGYLADQSYFVRHGTAAPLDGAGSDASDCTRARGAQ